MACRKEKTPMKLDFPEPFGPTTRLIGPSASASMDAMLLKPRMVMESSSGLVLIGITGSYTGRAWLKKRPSYISRSAMTMLAPEAPLAQARFIGCREVGLRLAATDETRLVDRFARRAARSADLGEVTLKRSTH